MKPQDIYRQLLETAMMYYQYKSRNVMALTAEEWWLLEELGTSFEDQAYRVLNDYPNHSLDALLAHVQDEVNYREQWITDPWKFPRVYATLLAVQYTLALVQERVNRREKSHAY